MTDTNQLADVTEPPLSVPDHPPGPLTPGWSNNYAVPAPAPVEPPPPEPIVAGFSNDRASRVEE